MDGSITQCKEIVMSLVAAGSSIQGPVNPASRRSQMVDRAESHEPHQNPILHRAVRAKLVLFGVPPEDRVADGPLMRGFLETEQGKVNVAGWKKVARESGNDYLSLRVGNSKPGDAEFSAATGHVEWTVGPYYGRLFKEVSSLRGGAKRSRYFGFIEDAVKAGEDAATGRPVYEVRWQLLIRAKPDVSGDGRTPYIKGTVSPREAEGRGNAGGLPF
jgi:uncharacterized protein (DUF736 family)